MSKKTERWFDSDHFLKKSLAVAGYNLVGTLLIYAMFFIAGCVFGVFSYFFGI